MTDPVHGGVTTALEELCRALGVQPAFRSGGRSHPADPESLATALRALGAPLDRPEDAAEALGAVRAAELRRPCPPTAVSWADEPPAVPVRLPAEATLAPLEVELVLEDGSRAARRVEPEEPSWTEEWRADGRSWRTARLPLPAELPLGYHDVRLATGGREGRTRVVRAPRTTWSRRPSGGRDWEAFLPLHALRTRDGFAVGDVSDLRRLCSWTADRGGTRVGTLPLYDAFLGPGEPFDPSPYAPASRLFWNPLWIALDEVPGLEAGPEGRRIREAHEAEGRALARAPTLDHRAAMALKRRILARTAEARRGDGPHRLGSRLTRWVEERPEALAYARFRAATEARNGPWPTWDGAAAAGDDEALAAPDPAVRYHVFAQWAVGEQLADLAETAPAGLYLDLPLGSHPDGFDHWRHRAVFARDFTVGAPPDAFFEGGQDWGFPPLHPRRAREDGHRYQAACLRTAMSVADALRLDHVMGLHRLYWIPRGAPASRGVYVRYPAEELWAVLCLESVRSRTEIVGEDLGTVPPEVPEAMERHGARRMWVLPFEVSAGGPPTSGPPPDSIASLNTHDLPTFAAFVEGLDIDARLGAGRIGPAEAEAEKAGRAAWRRALARLLHDEGCLPRERTSEDSAEAAPGDPDPASEPDTAALLEGALRFLAESDAATVLVSLEDLWLETEPQNVPGTPSSDNWSRRARRTLEEMDADPRVRELLETVHRHRR